MPRHRFSLEGYASENCRINGVDIRYIRSGKRQRSLVALHGLIGSGACLSPMAETLTANFDVILPDARGHGESSHPDQGYLYSTLAADVTGLIDELGLDAPVLLGHSMGGMTAAVVAAMTGSSISGLVLVDPTFISPELQREAFESGIAAEHGQLLALPRSELVARARERSPHRSSDMIDYLVDARLRTSPNAFEVLTPPNPNFRELVRNFRVPTLLVTGDFGVVSLDVAMELQRLNPLVRHALIPEVGHGLPYDKPVQVGEAALAFLLQAPFEDNDGSCGSDGSKHEPMNHRGR
jgi:N-formylmaleamate deformylase